jgi:hypothetical protein
MANPFKGTSLTTLWLEINFGSAISADTIAIHGHNLLTGSSIVLKSGNSPAPSSTLATLTWREFDMWQGFTDPSHQYYRLEITDSNTDPLAIGELVIGDRVNLSAKMSYGFMQGNMHQKVQHETIRGVKYVYDLFDRRVYTAQFQSIQDNMLAELNTLDGLTSGAKYPWTWIPNVDLSDVYYVRKENEYKNQSRRHNEWDVTLTLEEESRGGEVTL